MTKNLLINHDRFINKKPIIIEKKYVAFFNGYAKKNYSLKENNCLCKKKDDQFVSLVDRYSVEFDTVICKNCGLVRAPKYFRNEDVLDFYKNHYRYIMHNVSDENEKNYVDPEEFYEKQKKSGLQILDLIEKNSKIEIKGLKVLDLGGGVGGSLHHFKDSNDTYLVDYFDPYLQYAKKKNINVIEGGIKDVPFKPDIIIISHVLEHWNNFEEEIKNLISIQKLNKTINYIELPGIDSLKLGRREGDFLNDIHIPHLYYFASYVFENLMNRYGFEKLYIDSEIKSLFIYTGVKKELKNQYNEVKDDLVKAEFTRKKHIFKNYVKKFIPKKILDLRISYIKSALRANGKDSLNTIPPYAQNNITRSKNNKVHEGLISSEELNISEDNFENLLVSHPKFDVNILLLQLYIKLKKIIIFILYFFYKNSKNSAFRNKINNEYQLFKHISNKKKMDKNFKKFELTKHNKYSFYQIDKIPKDFLNNYYKKTYWQGRNDISNILRKRDFEHFNIIEKRMNLLEKKPLNILNFGSGHDGISILLRARGHSVTNLDYQQNDYTLYNEKYSFITDFDELSEKFSFDLIYSSHSLEHVSDIFKVLGEFKKYSNSNTQFFFEVPNGFNQKSIHPPHTYYFTTDFFKEIFDLNCEKEFFFESEIVKNRKIYKENINGGVIRLFTNTNLLI
mgnify:CR=1 FL=1|tara:strand:+ start:521 stop:2548 length:2028 start_codon:yes stop_codon:yes gene_type:complete